jgi:hypothetical protein
MSGVQLAIHFDLLGARKAVCGFALLMNTQQPWVSYSFPALEGVLFTLGKGSSAHALTWFNSKNDSGLDLVTNKKTKARAR